MLDLKKYLQNSKFMLVSDCTFGSVYLRFEANHIQCGNITDHNAKHRLKEQKIICFDLFFDGILKLDCTHLEAFLSST